MWAVVMDGMVCVCAGYLSVYDIFTITWWKGNSIKAFFARSLFLVVCMRDSQLFNYSHIRQVCLFFYITLSPALSLSLSCTQILNSDTWKELKFFANLMALVQINTINLCNVISTNCIRAMDNPIRNRISMVMLYACVLRDCPFRAVQ